MEVANFNSEKYPTREQARASLIRLLQDAHAGERAASNAYWGHAHSLFVTSKTEKSEILKIYHDEVHHRQRLGEMLKGLGAKPRPGRELAMWLIGAVIATLSYIGTWFIPMYGAGQLERTNIGEYEVAARLAFLAGESDIIEELVSFAEVEWDHEAFFRNKVEGHFLMKWLKIWPSPEKREWISESFLGFCKDETAR